LVHPILQDRVFYKRNELEHKLKVALNEVWSLEDQKSIRHFIDDNFSWENVKEKYNSALLIN